MATREVIRIGGLGPLSPPGIVQAGRELRDGMELAAQRINEAGGVLGRPLQLLFEDTMGTPAAGVAAVNTLLREGVHALAGEFHSVVADAIVELVQRAGLPFVCASATLDAITTRRLRCVFRVAPPQSYGWRVYADFLAAEGFRHVVALQEENVYWNAGAGVIEARLRDSGVRFARVPVRSATPSAPALVQQLEGMMSRAPAPDIVLLLIGYPEPLRSVVTELLSRGLVPPALFLGEPAGRTVFSDWWDVAGRDVTNVPFLAYARPQELSPEGKRLSERFEREHGREPTFVAFEGYDSVLALARAMDAAGSTDLTQVCDALCLVEVGGTRGTVAFSTEPEGVVHQQWRWPPVGVVAYRYPYQRFSAAVLLWEAERGGTGATLRRDPQGRLP
ncbi:MAG: ABC transporter substrate-binding protein [Candidatus Methylomirabilales bacterium]